jgi:hypothetical protein
MLRTTRTDVILCDYLMGISSSSATERGSTPPTLFTVPVLRYMKTYGLTHEQLALVSVV